MSIAVNDNQGAPLTGPQGGPPFAITSGNGQYATLDRPNNSRLEVQIFDPPHGAQGVLQNVVTLDYDVAVGEMFTSGTIVGADAGFVVAGVSDGGLYVQKIAYGARTNMDLTIEATAPLSGLTINAAAVANDLT